MKKYDKKPWKWGKVVKEETEKVQKTLNEEKMIAQNSLDEGKIWIINTIMNKEGTIWGKPDLNEEEHAYEGSMC